MSLVVYVAAAALFVAVLIRLRHPCRTLTDPLIRSTALAILLSSLVLVCSAPRTIAAVNKATGVSNFGAPLTYSMLTATSCSVLVLLLHWRGGPRERIRRTARQIVGVYGVVIAAIIGLFTYADAPMERLADIDTYYATTPGMREMTLLYLVGHTVAELALLGWSWSWQREVRGILRTGLRLIMAGCVLDLLGFLGAKYVAIWARWEGHDLDFLSTTVAPPLASLAALTAAAGFILPRVAPSTASALAARRTHRRLAPLWAEVRPVATAPKPPTAWWHSPHERLHHREVSIHDALLALAPYFDDRLRTTAHAAALARDHSPHEARVIAEAAMLADAVRRAGAVRGAGAVRSAGRHPDTGHTDHPSPSTYQLYATEESGPGALVELSRALAESPLVSAALGDTLPGSTSQDGPRHAH